MDSKLLVIPSPHIRNPATTRQIMADVLIALLPACAAATALFGWRAPVMVAVCVCCCVLFEYIFTRITRRPTSVGDLSAAITGALLALSLPAGLPFWMAAIGCFAAIFIVKQLFGGIGQNFANPAATARVLLLVSFAGAMSAFEGPVGGATPLAGGAIPPYLDMLLGFRGGSIGEVCLPALVLGGVYLMARRVITPIIPVCYIGAVGLIALVAGQDPLFHIMAGGVVFAGFFMLTDYTTSPATTPGKVIFAVGCAGLTMLIRLLGAYPEGVSFALLLMNILTPHIDRLTRTRPFGG